jgi:hypothetical protein
VFSTTYKKSVGNNQIPRDFYGAYLKTKELEEQFSVPGSQFTVGGRKLFSFERAKSHALVHGC